MKQPDLFDAAASRAARDMALAQVQEHTLDWWAAACAQVAQLRGWMGTGEDLRLVVRAVVGDPHSPNAWGALTATAIRNEWLSRTGERRAMRSVRSHARRTDVYRSR
jgi:hypothetical protein